MKMDHRFDSANRVTPYKRVFRVRNKLDSNDYIELTATDTISAMHEALDRLGYNVYVVRSTKRSVNND